MGDAKRRKDAGAVNGGIKIPPRKRAAGFRLVHHNRFEKQDKDGNVMAYNVFAVVAEDGKAVHEETPDGPQPVLLLSVPQAVRKSLVMRP
jgi:hypothetical protein